MRLPIETIGTAARAVDYPQIGQFVAIVIASLCLDACVGTPRIARPEPQPSFDAFAFFAGDTVGNGHLKKILSRTERTTVLGSGHIDLGTLVLDQTVSEGTKPPKHRQWRITNDAPGHYTGTLSNAVGAITGTVEGNRLHLAFTMKGDLHTDQWLSLAVDGRSAHNIMIVRKLGLRVAMLDEYIRKTN